MGDYPTEVSTVEAFIHRVAVDFIKNHYHYYVMGYVREGKDLRRTDLKIIAKYNVGINKWERYRRKQAGLSNVQYVRHEQTLVILATDPRGGHEFFRQEVEIRDAREVPLTYRGYEVSYRGRRVWVRIARGHYKQLWAYFTGIAMKRRVADLVREFRSLPYEPHRPVRYQLFRLLDEVNALRRRARHLELVPETAIRLIRVCPRRAEELEAATRFQDRPEGEGGGEALR
jgi:hypothetical protein